MKTVNSYSLVIVTAILALGACSQKNDKLDTIADLFLDSSKIIGGERLSPVHIVSSHVVALYDSTEKEICTGSIIAEDVILTAGHCIPSDFSNLKVLFGVNARKSLAIRTVQFAGTHIDYRPKDIGSWSDIGLVYFTGGLPEGFSPISIVQDELLLQKGVLTELAGYGQNNGIKKTGIGYLRHTTVQVEDPAFGYGEVELNQTQGSGACHGDSGGPAYIVEDSQIKLWGITSRGEKDKEDNCTHYSIYTNAVTYSAWINSSIKSIHEAIEKKIAKTTSPVPNLGENIEVKNPESNNAGNTSTSALKIAAELHLFR
jgi:secreted trypsin-like serine protease